MKKLIFLFAILLSGWIANAQMLVSQGADKQTFFYNSSTYTLTNTTVKYWQVNAQVDWPTSQVATVTITKGTGALSNVACALYGRASSQTSTWTAIGSAINWKLTTADTVIINTNTSENRYRQYKYLFTGTGTGTAIIGPLEMKLYYPD